MNQIKGDAWYWAFLIFFAIIFVILFVVIMPFFTNVLFDRLILSIVFSGVISAFFLSVGNVEKIDKKLINASDEEKVKLKKKEKNYKDYLFYSYICKCLCYFICSYNAIFYKRLI